MAQVSERELFTRLLDGLLASRESCRGLGLHRSDEEWIALAGLFDQIRDKATKLMHTPRSRRASGLILPPRAH